MRKIETELLDALRELERTVAALPVADPKPDLIPLFDRIDALGKELPPETEPVLRHYLAKRSYEKARLFLLGRENENQPGPCGHV